MTRPRTAGAVTSAGAPVRRDRPRPVPPRWGAGSGYGVTAGRGRPHPMGSGSPAPSRGRWTAARCRVLTGQQRNAGHHGVEGDVRQRHRLQYRGAQPVVDDTSRHGSGLLHGAGLLGRGRCRCGGADSDRLRGIPQPGSVRIGHALHPAFLPEAQVDMRIAHPPRDRRIFRLAFRVAREPRPRRRTRRGNAPALPVQGLSDRGSTAAVHSADLRADEHPG